MLKFHAVLRFGYFPCGKGGQPFYKINRSNSGLTSQLKYHHYKNKLHLWTSLISEANSNDVNNLSQNSDDILFSGLYNTYEGFSNFIIDGYILLKTNLSESINTGKLYTFGFRTASAKKPTSFDHTLEIVFQTGTTDQDLSILAYAGALNLGFRFQMKLPMRISVEGDYASGDKDNSDETHSTFHNLVPSNHAYYGQSDLISWQNMFAFSAAYQIWPLEKLELKFSYFYVGRAEVSDSWYAVVGGRAQNNLWITNSETGSISNQNHLFHEIDFLASYQLWKYLKVSSGFSYVIRGSAPLQAEKDSDYIFFFLSTKAQF